MKRLLLIMLVSSLLSACGSSDKDISGLNSAEIAYVEWYEALQKDLRAAPDHPEIPFETAREREEFDTLLREAYRGKIARQEFVERIVTAFPDHGETVEFIAQHLPE